jgi:hypothetical protein
VKLRRNENVFFPHENPRNFSKTKPLSNGREYPKLKRMPKVEANGKSEDNA